MILSLELAGAFYSKELLSCLKIRKKEIFLVLSRSVFSKESSFFLNIYLLFIFSQRRVFCFFFEKQQTAKIGYSIIFTLDILEITHKTYRCG